jgi:thioesterase domain-containing protein/acyl carrier protein
VEPIALEKHTPHESAVRHLYADVLGLRDDEVAIDASFFSLGGDSLLATILMAHINRAFDANLPMRVVFEEETVRRLAAQVDDLTKRPPQGRPVALRKSGTRSPIFCVHPASGFGRPYLTLLPHLNVEWPVYALESCGLQDGDVLPASIEDLCESYIEQILVVQPSGAYKLLGWSFGAIAAHAIATRMQQRGLAIASLIMIDGCLCQSEPSPEEMFIGELEPLLERLASYKEYRDASGSLQRTMVERMCAVHKNNFRLSYYPDPQVFRGDVMFVTPTVGRLSSQEDVWGPYIRGKVAEVKVPIHHNVLLEPEAVELYAARLASFLERVGADT